MTTPSRLDLKNHPGPPRYRPCLAEKRLDDGSSARCEGRDGHEGPHVIRVTLTWESDPRVE